jgi:hypothetical protein
VLLFVDVVESQRLELRLDRGLGGKRSLSFWPTDQSEQRFKGDEIHEKIDVVMIDSVFVLSRSLLPKTRSCRQGMLKLSLQLWHCP